MKRISYRTLLALWALITLFLALWGGLVRLQWRFPIPQANWISFHGPLMVSGFFGTIIGMARANILKSKMGLMVPWATALGSWIFLSGGSENRGALLFLAASLGYIGVSIGFFRKQPADVATLALLGGLGWAWSNYFWWRGEPIPHIMTGWQILFVLTITSERLEAIHWNPSRLQIWAVGIACGFILAGMFLQPFTPATGVRIASIGYLLLALLLFYLDHGWKNPPPGGWKRYTQICLLSAYLWLFIGAWVGLIAGPTDSGFAYDAFLHCVFLGLVFSMVFSHVPLLLPRVLKTPVPFHPFFYSHWLLLQISLLARVGGDILESTPWRRWGALLNAIAILLFILNTAHAVIQGRRSQFI